MEAQLADILENLHREFPRFRMLPKPQALTQRLLHRILWGLSLGRQKDYLDGYVTTLGQTVYVPGDFDAWSDQERTIVLHHEREHLRQFRRLTFCGMALCYLLPFFPVGLAWGRARLEWQAYRATIRATWRLRGPDAARALRPEILDRFTGPDYLWMWPFPDQVGRWFDAEIRRLEADGD